MVRLFDVLPNLNFIKSGTIPIITYEHGIFQMPYKFPNLLGLMVLGN